MLLWFFMPEQRLYEKEAKKERRFSFEEAFDELEDKLEDIFERDVKKSYKARKKAFKRAYKAQKRALKQSVKHKNVRRRSVQFEKAENQAYADEIPKTMPESRIFEVPDGSIQEILDALVLHLQNKVPDDVLTQVFSIRASILSVLPQLEASGRVTEEGFNVQQTAKEYLPDALNKYLELPPHFAKSQLLSNGQTAHDTLIEQLALLDTTMQRIMTDVFKEDADALLIHGRFLKEKFSGKFFDIPQDEVRPTQTEEIKALPAEGTGQVFPSTIKSEKKVRA